MFDDYRWDYRAHTSSTCQIHQLADGAFMRILFKSVKKQLSFDGQNRRALTWEFQYFKDRIRMLLRPIISGPDNLGQLNTFIFLSCGTEQHHDKHLNQGTKPISSKTSTLVQHGLHMTWRSHEDLFSLFSHSNKGHPVIVAKAYTIFWPPAIQSMSNPRRASSECNRADFFCDFSCMLIE